MTEVPTITSAADPDPLTRSNATRQCLRRTAAAISWWGPSVVVAIILAVGSSRAIADEKQPGPTEQKSIFDVPNAGIPEDPLIPLDPADPPTDVEQRQIEARKLFVIGLGELDRREFRSAKSTFERAIELDPNNVSILKELIPLTLQAGDVDRGLEYCKRAIELDPEDYELLHLLATREGEAGRLDEAVRLLGQAANIPGLIDRDPRMYLLIQGDRADHLIRLGRFADAVEPLRELIRVAENPGQYPINEFARRQLDRRRFMDYERLGQALAKTGQTKEAIELLTKAKESDERGKRLALVLAQIHFDHGDWGNALKELEAYIALGAQNREALELYAQSLEKLSRSEELVAHLGQWLGNDPNNAVLREFYVERLIAAGDLERAQSELERLRGRASAVDLKVQLFRKTNQPDKLLELLVDSIQSMDRFTSLADEMKAIATDPEFTERLGEVARGMDPNDPKSFFASLIVADIAAKADKIDLAVECLDRCVNDKNFPRARDAYGQYIELLWTHRRYEDLLRVIDNAEAGEPAGRSVYLEYRTRALEALGKGEEAIALLKDAINGAQSTLESTRYRLMLARIQLQREAFDEAIQLCQTVIDDAGEGDSSIFAKYLLATIYSQKGDLDEFETLVLSMLAEPEELDASFVATLNNDLGYTWADHDKNLDQAEVLIRRALELKPNEPAYLDSMGWVLFKKGDAKGAIDHLVRATDAPEGQDAVIYDHLGDAYLKDGQPEKSREAWSRALELSTESPRGKEQRSQIEAKIKLLLDDKNSTGK